MSGDIVVTQDYGLAAMVLSKKAYAIHQNGKWYTDENIGEMLEQRALAKKLRRATGKHHLKGPAKRTAEDDKKFEESFIRLIRRVLDMNSTITDIMNRYSCRRYKDEALDENVLKAIIEAGRVAPCGGNNQTNKFYVVKSKDILNKLIATAEQEFAAMELTEDLYKSLKTTIRLSKKGGYDFTYKAPVVIVITNKKDYDNAMADAVCANMSMMIAATSLGVGSCYLNQLHWLDNSEAIRDVLGISANETISCSLALGMPDQKPVKHREITGNVVVEL